MAKGTKFCSSNRQKFSSSWGCFKRSQQTILAALHLLSFGGFMFFSVDWHHTYQKADQKRHFVLILVMGREERTTCFLREVNYCFSHLHNHSFLLQNWAKFVSLLQTQKKYSKEAEVLWKLLNEETLIERLFCPK